MGYEGRETRAIRQAEIEQQQAEQRYYDIIAEIKKKGVEEYIKANHTGNIYYFRQYLSLYWDDQNLKEEERDKERLYREVTEIMLDVAPDNYYSHYRNAKIMWREQKEEEAKEEFLMAYTLADETSRSDIIDDLEGLAKDKYYIATARWAKGVLPLIYAYAVWESKQLSAQQPVSIELFNHWYKQRKQWISMGLCHYCGGQVGGFIIKKCKSCGESQ